MSGRVWRSKSGYLKSRLFFRAFQVLLRLNHKVVLLGHARFVQCDDVVEPVANPRVNNDLLKSTASGVRYRSSPEQSLKCRIGIVC